MCHPATVAPRAISGPEIGDEDAIAGEGMSGIEDLHRPAGRGIHLGDMFDRAKLGAAIEEDEHLAATVAHLGERGFLGCVCSGRALQGGAGVLGRGGWCGGTLGVSLRWRGAIAAWGAEEEQGEGDKATMETQINLHCGIEIGAAMRSSRGGQGVGDPVILLALGWGLLCISLLLSKGKWE